MLTRTPNPTAAKLLNQLPLTGAPNMPAILRELLERLRVDFPVALKAINPDAAVPRTADQYKLAPAVLGDGFAHTILVGNDLDFEEASVSVWFSGSTLQIFIVDEKRRDGFNIYAYWDQIAAITTVLWTYHKCCVDDSGANLWKSLKPQSIQGLPEEFASGYHGVMLTYRMEFNPKCNGWPQVLEGSNL